MRKHLTGALAALTLATAVAGRGAHAQTLYGTAPQPPVSPYINVLRGGAAAGVNYYNIVQPQLQFYSAINQLQAQQQQQQAAIAMSSMGYETTGHPVQFYNYSHFYPQPALGMRSPTFTGATSQPYRPQMPSRSLGVASTVFPPAGR